MCTNVQVLCSLVSSTKYHEPVSVATQILNIVSMLEYSCDGLRRFLCTLFFFLTNMLMYATSPNTAIRIYPQLGPSIGWKKCVTFHPDWCHKIVMKSISVERRLRFVFSSLLSPHHFYFLLLSLPFFLLPLPFFSLFLFFSLLPLFWNHPPNLQVPSFSLFTLFPILSLLSSLLPLRDAQQRKYRKLKFRESLLKYE